MPLLREQPTLFEQGYQRVERQGAALAVTQDRIALSAPKRTRIVESLEAALRHGQGRVAVQPLDAQGGPAAIRRFSADLHCADCDIHYHDPAPHLFSFNSPIGACETCRGFGRSIGIDYGLVIPADTKSLAAGVITLYEKVKAEKFKDLAAKYG